LGFLLGFGAYVTFEAINLAAQFAATNGFRQCELDDPQIKRPFRFSPNPRLVALMVLSGGYASRVIAAFCDELQRPNTNRLAWIRWLMKLRGVLPGTLSHADNGGTYLLVWHQIAIGVVSSPDATMNVMLFSFPVNYSPRFALFIWSRPILLDYLEQF